MSTTKASSYLKNWVSKSLALTGLFLTSDVFASSEGDLPFVSTMNALKADISGPFLLAGAIIMIVITCLMLAFGEWGDGFKKMINIVLWLSVAFMASGFVTTMFGGGAVF